MPFRHTMYHLLAKGRERDLQALHAVDASARAAIDEARAKRDLHLEHLGYPLRTASPTPEVETTERGVPAPPGRSARSIGSETLEVRVERMKS